MKTLLSLLLVAALAAGGGWWFGTRQHHPQPSAEKKVLYYQSPMHPWVKSDQPGHCTVCGMELVPVYAGGEQKAASTDLVLLPEGSTHASNVRTVEVKKQPLARTLRVAGMIEDDDSKHRVLSAYTGGRIEKLFVNYEGADIEQGQPLATFYSKELLGAIREYKVAYGQGASPLLTAAEMRLQQLGLSREEIAKAHQRSEKEIFINILAPINGTVVKRYVYEGQYVQEGEKLFELADFSTMWFQFIAYEQDLPLLRVGLPVTITTPSLPGRSLTSTITFINPNIDGATRSARVRVEFKNPLDTSGGLHRQHEILHQLYAEATVALDAPEVVAAPRQAVLWAGGSPRVYVAKADGAYEQRSVILGRPGDETWEILEGLQPGECIVASGNMLIDSQAQLNNLSKPEEPPASAKEMTAEEHAAVEKFLKAAAEAGTALADEDLMAYNLALKRLPAPPPGVDLAPPPAATDLVTARRTFLPASQKIADFARTVRAHFPELRIFRCPMSDQVGGGAPENARWIQFTRDLKNPYMGKEMLTCGAEVK